MNLLLVNMIVRYDKIKSIALAQGNDFNFNISLTRRQIKLIKKAIIPISCKTQAWFYILFWSNCHS